MIQSQDAIALGQMVHIGSIQKTLGDTRGFLSAEFYLRLPREQRY